MSETPTWPSSQDLREETLRGMAEQNGGTLERDPAGRLVLVHDLRDLLQR